MVRSSTCHPRLSVSGLSARSRATRTEHSHTALEEQLLDNPLTPDEIARIGAAIRFGPWLGQWPEEPGEVPVPPPMDEEATLIAGGLDPTGESYRLVSPPSSAWLRLWTAKPLADALRLQNSPRT